MGDQQPAAAPASMEWVVARVNARIAEALEADAAPRIAMDPELREPLESLSGLVLAGGKRLRPAFCYWAFVGRGGRPDDPRVVNAGAALELLHASALIHDDVLDGSPQRHGVDTVHADFERRHAEGRWRGEGRRFGEGVAILVGDLALVYADLLLGDVPRAAVDIWSE